MIRAFTALGRFNLRLAAIFGSRTDAPAAEPQVEPALVTEAAPAKKRSALRRHAIVGLSLPVIALIAGLTAFAYFTSTGTGSGGASVGTLTAPGAPTRTGSGATVVLNWSASTVSGGGTISYHVERSSSPYTTWSDACSPSTTTSTGCTDSPTAGTYKYRVTAIYHSWTALGPDSAAFTAAASDTTPPTVTDVTITNSITGAEGVLKQGSGYYVYANAADNIGGSGLASVTADVSTLTTSATAVALTACSSGCTVGSTTYGFKSALQTANGSLSEGAKAYTVTATDNVALTGNKIGSTTVDNTAPVSSAVLSPVANGAGWNSSQPVQVTLSATDANGIDTISFSKAGAEISASATYSAPFNVTTEGTTTVSFHARDKAGNVESPDKTKAVKIDLTAPVTSDNTASIGNGWKSTDQTVTLSVVETGSGVDKTYYTTNGSTPTTSSAVYSSGILLSAAGTYTIKYFTVDVAGNTESVKTAGTVIRIDKTAPSAPTVTPSAATGSNTFVSGSTVFINPQGGNSGSFQVAATGSTDAESGLSKINFPALTGFTSGGGDVASPGPYTTTYSWTGAVGATGAQTVTAYNGATPALTAGASFTVTPDITAPTGGSVSYTNGYFTSASVSVTFASGTDGGSDVNTGSGILQRASATLTNGGCGSFSSFADLVTNPTSAYADTSVTSGNCYQYRYRISDRVGNQATYTNANIAKVDTTAPTNALTLNLTSGGAFLSGTNLFYRSNAAGSFTITNAVTDAESGAASATFPAIAAGNMAHTVETVSTPTGGPFPSSAYTWTSAATFASTHTIIGTNNAGTSNAGTALTFVRDTTAPAGGNLTVDSTGASGAGSTSTTTSTSFAVDSRADYTETASGTASGLASSTLTVQSATLTGTTCGAAGSGGPFTSATTVSGTTQPAGILAGYCYVYTLTGSDKVGNSASISTTVKVTLASDLGNNLASPCTTLSSTVHSCTLTNITSTNGRKVLVLVYAKGSNSNTSTIASITGPFASAAQITSNHFDTSPHAYLYAWQATGNGTTGSVTVNFDSGTSAGTVFIDVVQLSPTGAVVTSGINANTTKTATASLTVSGASNGEIAIVAVDETRTFTVPAGFTTLATVALSGNLFGSFSGIPVQSSADWVLSTAGAAPHWGTIAIEISP